MTETSRIVVVDDHPIWREGVVKTLNDNKDFEVVGEGSSAAEAFNLVEEFLPDVILLDVSMPGGGIEAAKRISSAYPVVTIIMLTVSEREEDVRDALRAHARGYVLKGVSGGELVAVVRQISEGDTFITPSLAASLLMESSEKEDQSGKADLNLPELLNDRERQILEKLADGMSNKDIAASIHLSEKTVKHYMTNIMQKLQVHNRVQAALMAHGLMKSDPESN